MADVRIVLVEPSHPGNIGGAARAMKTMGLTSLCLVRPARFPDPQADWRAARAVDVLAQARVVDSLDEAICDCVLAVGTSTRSRRIPIPLADPQSVAERLASGYADAPVAILFGRETSGLTNEELQRCQLHLSIPASPEYPSLNLAMSVQVVCYELFKARSGSQTTAAPANEPGLATLDEVEGFLAHFEKVLERIDFLKSSAPPAGDAPPAPHVRPHRPRADGSRHAPRHPHPHRNHQQPQTRTRRLARLRLRPTRHVLKTTRY